MPRRRKTILIALAKSHTALADVIESRKIVMQMAEKSAINKSHIKINLSVAIEVGICMMRGTYRQSKHQSKHSSIALRRRLQPVWCRKIMLQMWCVGGIAGSWRLSLFMPNQINAHWIWYSDFYIYCIWRGENERGVNISDRSGVIKRGFKTNMDPQMFQDIWITWAFQANIMYEPVDILL